MAKRSDLGGGKLYLLKVDILKNNRIDHYSYFDLKLCRRYLSIESKSINIEYEILFYLQQ